MPDAIVTFEEHGEVLSHWHERRWSEETVVVFDHHLDLKRIDERRLLRLREAAAAGRPIGGLNRDLPFRDDQQFVFGLDNFLYAAGALGMLRRVVWVAPALVAGTAAKRRALLWDRLSLIAGHGEECLRHFTEDAVSVSSRVAGLCVQLTDLHGLRSIALPQGTRLDLDLDFFFDEGRGQTHAVAEVVEVLRARGLLDEPPAATFSIHSGFMPEDFRWLGAALAGQLGFALQDPPPRRPPAPLTMRVLASNAAPDRDTLARCAAELTAVGGPGWTLRAVLAVAAEALSEAADYHSRAVEAGDRACWAAYAIGLKWMERRRYVEAADWLERAQDELVDTIQVHALLLRAICEFRVGRWEQSLALAEQARLLVPMRKEGHVVVAAAARHLGRAAVRERALHALAELQQIRDRPGSAGEEGGQRE